MSPPATTDVISQKRDDILSMAHIIKLLCISREKFVQKCSDIKIENGVKTPNAAQPAFLCTSVTQLERRIEASIAELDKCQRDLIELETKHGLIGSDTTDERLLSTDTLLYHSMVNADSADVDEPMTMLGKWTQELEAKWRQTQNEPSSALANSTTSVFGHFYESQCGEEVLKFVAMHHGYCIRVTLSNKQDSITATCTPYIDDIDEALASSITQETISPLISCIASHIDTDIVPYS